MPFSSSSVVLLTVTLPPAIPESFPVWLMEIQLPPPALYRLIGLPSSPTASDRLARSPTADSQTCSRRERLSGSRPCKGRTDELPAETVRVCWLRMVMALYGVGHALTNRVPRLKAAQEAPPVVRDRRFPQNPDQFRVHW